MSAALNWDTDGRVWPHRAASRFVTAGGLTWHVQEMGPETDGAPVAVLLHGTGAATHSWRSLMPLLAHEYRVIAMDLPGHGFTRGKPPGGLTLPGMAKAVAALLAAMEATPSLLVGHSAGAAIALTLARQYPKMPRLVGINPALSPFPGFFAPLFQTLARALVLNPLVPRLFARSKRTVAETEPFLFRATGSRIDAEGLRAYTVLLGNAAHCRGAVEMMAGWDLEALQRDLPGITAPVLLIHGARDRTVPTSSVEQARKSMQDARLVLLAGLGHLAHEERPDLVAEAIGSFAPASG
jgi:magnesium chelatase accessory protein